MKLVPENKPVDSLEKKICFINNEIRRYPAFSKTRLRSS